MDTLTAGIVLFAHGSRVESANDAVRKTARSLAAQGGYLLVEAAFLELTEPGLVEAIDRLVEQGADRVVVVPYFLTLGTHMQRDLPVLLEAAVYKHPGLAVASTPPMDGHPALIQVLLDRAGEAIASPVTSPAATTATAAVVV